MPLPEGLDRVTLTGRYLSIGGRAPKGSITIEAPSWMVDTLNNVVFALDERVLLDDNGAFTVELVATDADHLIPSPFLYQMVENIRGLPSHRYAIALPKANPVVDISDLINLTPPVGGPDIVRVPGPQGPAGVQGPLGPAGPTGPGGASGTVHTHTQPTGSPASNWIITHNLGHVVSAVVVLDSTNQSVVADVENNSLNSATIIFPYPVSGTAVLH